MPASDVSLENYSCVVSIGCSGCAAGGGEGAGAFYSFLSEWLAWRFFLRPISWEELLAVPAARKFAFESSIVLNCCWDWVAVWTLLSSS